MGPGPSSTPSGRALIVVLPFANLSGDRTQEYFSDGITEDIIAALGQFPIFRSSVTTLSGSIRAGRLRLAC